ncbi:hypothetical protein Mucpa_5154 [Mucilaginibacter paludis DSM 18603]|uniref:Uncharacterized protein n=1 Tax=Mucilaginibacter paludis DSM 18603 TaxID=714943 RepID=H1Y104_9SPHI|nr:hypothetical protein Mucpa_5154 [Mucilaginibacter paludis DSM 18603]
MDYQPWTIDYGPWTKTPFLNPDSFFLPLLLLNFVSTKQKIS